MKYRVTLDAYVIGGPAMPKHLPPIPLTTIVMIMDTEDETHMAKDMWDGYLEMREKQAKNPPKHKDDWATIKKTANDPPEQQFREAVNIFMRFMAGEGRDNCLQVTKIESA